MAKNNPQILKLTWGVALILVGVAVFFRIPQVIPQLVQMGQSTTAVWFVRICFYLIGFLLIGGGINKIVQYSRSQSTAAKEEARKQGEDDMSR